MSTLLEAALESAALGHPVFPCAPGKKIPLTKNGFLDATTEGAQIETFWREHPDANVGMVTAGLVVIDIDGADNSWPEDPAMARGLAATAVSLTPHGGRHCIFRQPEGKAWRNTVGTIAPKVDTRADGGYILLPPSVVDGIPYRWAEASALSWSADLAEPPAWLQAVLDRNGAPPGARKAPKHDVDSPGGNVIPAGRRNATLASLAGNMRRVGMTREEILAALERVNAGRCRPPLSAREVQQIATSISGYDADEVAVAVAEGRRARPSTMVEATNDTSPRIQDPGPLPEELLRVPGFVSEVMDHSLATAPYPNIAMAFAGALALQAVLAGRKVRDPGDNRTNIYLLGLAYSSAGKEWPRKINTEILNGVGLLNRLGGRFASGEGIQDALFTEPCMLFQTDEFDGMLQSMAKARDARHESMMETMLIVYSAANGILPMRRRASEKPPGTIDQPCLVILGTAIPNHFYQALTERMLTNGFFARMIVVECGKRPPGQEPRILPVPERILETARFWAKPIVGTGDLGDLHPVPLVVSMTDEAMRILTGTRVEMEEEYAKAERAGDAVGMTVWGRANEHGRKLALLYAVSESHTHPRIGKAAAEWSSRFAIHQAKRMLFMAQSHVADNQFHAECLKFLRILRAAPSEGLAHSTGLRRMKTDAKTFMLIVSTLEESGDIVVRTQSTATKSGRFYRLPAAGNGGRPG